MTDLEVSRAAGKVELEEREKSSPGNFSEVKGSKELGRFHTERDQLHGLCVAPSNRLDSSGQRTGERHRLCPDCVL